MLAGLNRTLGRDFYCSPAPHSPTLDVGFFRTACLVQGFEPIHSRDLESTQNTWYINYFGLLSGNTHGWIALSFFSSLCLENIGGFSL